MRSKLGMVAPLVLVHACAACVCGEAPPFDPDDLRTIELGGGIQAKVYLEQNWRVIDVRALSGESGQDPNVCFEGKFECTIQPDKLKLVDLAVSPSPKEKWATIILGDTLMKRASSYVLNDNLWFCGRLRKAGARYPEFVAVDIQKMASENQRWVRSIDRLRAQRDADGLVALGLKIKLQARDNMGKGGIEDYDALVLLAKKAIREGLTMKEDALRPDDFDRMFDVAQKWLERLDDGAKYRKLVEQILEKNPDHPKASEVAEKEFLLGKYEGKWRTKEEIAKLEKEKEEANKAAQALDKARLAEVEKKRQKEARERADRLAARQVALRTTEPKAREQALLSLGEAARTCLDTGFGVEAVDILVNVPDTAAVQALCTAIKSTDPTVRTQAFEALAWRGGRQDQVALEGFQAALKAENDRGTAFTAVAAAETLDAATAAGVLYQGLDNPSSAVQEVVMEGLRTVTKQQFRNKQEWQVWWQRNKDSLKPN